MSSTPGVGAGILALAATALVVTATPAQGVGPDFVGSAGVYAVDTDALTFTGPGASFTGSVVGGSATFSFSSLTVPAGTTILVKGGHAVALVADGPVVVGGLISGNGENAGSFDSSANLGGPGGGSGGMPGLAGAGTGGGGAGDVDNGGGGGGFGGAGARGGVRFGTSTAAPGAGGAAYGNVDLALQGGSGGAGGSTVSGGGGGGAIAIVGSSVTITSTGVVEVDGGGGSIGGGGGSGGGSGGGILLHAATVDVAGTLSARGGNGGLGGCCGEGGGGGGGRIAYQYRTIAASGNARVTPGLSGAGGDGQHSVDATGAPGVITLTPPPNTTITGARIRSGRHSATFRFAATGVATAFECKLRRPHRAGHYRSCTSPTVYRHLAPGRNTFLVRAIGPAGPDATPATKRFRIH